MRAIRVHELGGPDVLRYEDVVLPEPVPGQALVKLEAIGLNFIDCYFRTGAYKTALPFTPGMEAAGIVEALGPDVTEVRVGDRVAYAPHMGAYAEYVVVPAERLVQIPKGLDARSAAAAILQGNTAHYLATSVYPLKQGDTALVHAAAGGVGSLLIQIAKMRGARVFGTVSTREKAELARQAGADEVILYTEQDFEAEVMRLTNGKGVNVVYDAVAKTTFDKSLKCVGIRGTLALFGQASGPVPPVDPLRLWENSVFLTRPALAQYTLTRAELLERAGDVLGWVMSGKLRVRINQMLPLKDAPEAHRLLEGRKTTGKVLLIP
ncbi:MAG TPA: quinone oxidoreductase [Candidatus Methylomirabilis sp.]|nr:quinone oxidoreductase [Candidatus Methylomirabilis sp.]